MDRCTSCSPLLLPLLVSMCLLVAQLGHVAGTRIRGVSVSKSSLYRPDRDFECLDGSLRVPFTHVNDDYCDCADGSDEPGTAACADGMFYCENVAHKPRYIPSAWVNDGICDCCDTSDEYASSTSGRAQCVNNCSELGREAREKQQKAEQLAREGNKLRLELAAKGKTVKAEHQSHLVKLRADYTEAELVKQEKEILKAEVEEKEKLALQKCRPVEPEQSTTAEESNDEEADKELKEAKEFFERLDSDSSDTVTLAELQTRSTFDKDRDGYVSEDEALYFLDNREEVTLREFLDGSWMNIKPFLMMEQGMFKAAEEIEDLPPEVDAASHVEESLDDLSFEHEKKRDEGEAIEGEEEEDINDEESEKEAEPAIEYDEETQAIVNEAIAARERFQEAERAVNDIQSEIKELEEKMERDYGPKDEFAPLDGECFEYTDTEYIYKLCLYGKASQRSKSGGSDISLGHWHSWVGPTGNKYAKMKYDRGFTCWNGPARSTIVTLSCGMENVLTSVTEPNRCEYAMELSTPALCNPDAEAVDTHDEL